MATSSQRSAACSTEEGLTPSKWGRRTKMSGQRPLDHDPLFAPYLAIPGTTSIKGASTTRSMTNSTIKTKFRANKGNLGNEKRLRAN